jgi:hypothetical protein
LISAAAPAFDGFLVSRFLARNEPPFFFERLDAADTGLEYGAVLTRVLRKNETRFPN